jgi:transcriptional regulator with XRE-family HTH domain
MLNHDLYTRVRQLRDSERLTFRAIGEHLGISHQAAWQLYQRATQPPRPRRPKRRPKRYQ